MNKETLKKFIGRKDVYAIQLESGAYIPVKSSITEADLDKHLKGEKTIGTYVLNKDNTTNFACVDIDCEVDEWEEKKEVLLELGNLVYQFFPEFKRVLEFSGRRGYHIWIFMKDSEPAELVRDLVKTRLRMAGVSPTIEVFPKQSQLSGKGFGNLIKIPLGKHKKGSWSKIIKSDL